MQIPPITHRPIRQTPLAQRWPNKSYPQQACDGAALRFGQYPLDRQHALWQALKANDLKALQELLWPTPKFNKHGQRLYNLLARPIRINQPNSRDISPLRYACIEKNLPMMEILLQHPDIDPNARDKNGWTVLHLASIRGSVEVVKRLLQDPRVDVNAPGVDNITPLMYAIESKKIEMVKAFLAHPQINLNAVSDVGYTALTVATEVMRHEEIAKLLLSRPDLDVNQANKYGETALSLAIRDNNYEMLELLVTRPDLDFTKTKNYDWLDFSPMFYRQYLHLLKTIVSEPILTPQLEWLHTRVFITIAQNEEGWHLLRQLQAHPALQKPENERLLDQLNYFLGDWESQRMGLQKSQWVEHLGALMATNGPTRALTAVFQNLDGFYSNTPFRIGHDENEAELLLFCRHPNGAPLFFRELSLAITSINDFLTHGIYDISSETMDTWGKIGLFTHNFRAWRFDTQFGEDSLFAQYGYKAIPSRETDGIFGKGYLLTGADTMPEALDPQTVVEFRRGYLLVSHPKKGTLIIRNSSKKFGRDLMPHPAYYSKIPLTAEDLKTLNPQTDQRFQHMLEAELYVDEQTPSKLSFLADELLRLKTDYASWKFDPRFFRAESFEGHRTQGFKAIVNFLKELDFQQSIGEYNAPLPDLAFIHPDYPPFEPYARLPMTSEILDGELTDLINNTWTEEKYPASPLMPFIQAGVDNQAELVLLTPETP